MNKKIVLATNNQNKLREVSAILAPLGIEVISQRDAGANCDPEENGTTFAENAVIKAKAVYETVKMPVIADDSGICVDALDGRPGVYSARYVECAKLLDEMKDIPENKRQAEFRCVIAYVDGDSEFTVEGVCRGSIGFQEQGENGFGYDPIFVYDGRTMAEMTDDEKNKISHRSMALNNLYDRLKER